MQNSTNSENGNLTAGTNISCWFEKKLISNNFPMLESNLETDVVIVGAGIAGLTTAYCLASSGRKVIVVEDGFIGSGETGRTTAQIVTALEDRYFHMEEIFGKENARLIAESHRAAINFIEQTVQHEKIDCDFEKLNGYLFLHPTDQKENLQKELDALSRCGINADILEKTPGIPFEKKCIHYSDQAQFQPMKYLLGLCKAIEKKGGQIFINTHVSKINHSGIESDKGFTIQANHIVVATNAPVNDKYSMMLKQWAYRSYVIGALIKKNILPKALWWDTGDRNITTGNPYHYVRLHSHTDEYDLLICGGEDHIVGEESNVTGEERYIRLEEWARERFSIEDVIYKWSGEVLVPMDSIPYIGRNRFDKDNVYIITGDSGIGMTYCTIGGMLINDLINGVQNKWEDIYKPSRFILKTSEPFFKMLKDDFVAIFKKWFYSGSAEINSVKPNEGKIVSLDGKKCGAYRDASGKLFLVSAECTHLKCMVVWNDGEKSWDCPCHGSRFTYSGKVINGPANENLLAFQEPTTIH
jgi:glycine/D-amino acid oxidase-like deaminating enzyme/nitrite reductase/ring-hydroxylating ferredoxin subunit